MSDHDRYRELTGAYVVGALEPPERAVLEAHLGRCARCRDDVLAFAPLPALLARATVEDLDADDATDPVGAGSGADAVVGTVRSEVAAVARSRRRWRAAAAAAAVVVVALTLGVGVVLRPGVGDGDGPFGPGVALDVAAAGAGTARVTAHERAWGTYLFLSVEGLPERDRYELWIVDRAGGWHPAGSWASTSDRVARLGGSSELALADIDRVVVTSADRDDELLVAG